MHLFTVVRICVVDILKNGIEASEETYPHDNRADTRVVVLHDDSVTRYDACDYNIATSLLHRTEEVWPDTVLDGMTLSLKRSANSSINEHISNALAQQAVA
jgi:hypothetical protein